MRHDKKYDKLNKKLNRIKSIKNAEQKKVVFNTASDINNKLLNDFITEFNIIIAFRYRNVRLLEK